MAWVATAVPAAAGVGDALLLGKSNSGGKQTTSASANVSSGPAFKFTNSAGGNRAAVPNTDMWMHTGLGNFEENCVTQGFLGVGAGTHTAALRFESWNTENAIADASVSVIFVPGALQGAEVSTNEGTVDRPLP